MMFLIVGWCLCLSCMMIPNSFACVFCSGGLIDFDLELLLLVFVCWVKYCVVCFGWVYIQPSSSSTLTTSSKQCRILRC